LLRKEREGRDFLRFLEVERVAKRGREAIGSSCAKNFFVWSVLGRERFGCRSIKQAREREREGGREGNI